jgi:hypothetical protein
MVPTAEVVPAEPLRDTQRSRLITNAYAEAEPFCKWTAVNAIVLRAVRAQRWSDEEIRTAVVRLAEEQRPVTVDTLRFALQHPNGIGAGAKVRNGLALAARYAEEDAHREAIGQ